MKGSLIAVAFAALALSTATASAQSFVAFTDDGTITTVDVKAMKAGKSVKVSGPSAALLGIDVRPADGMVYGLFADGTVATIDPATGMATAKSKLDTMLKAGAMATVDFNPVADRLRVIGSDGANLRANVDDGKVTTDKPLKYADGDMSNGKTPMIAAGGYTNSMKGAKETVLYDIDIGTGALVKQAPPNDGVLNSVGKLGIMPKAVAFDIVTTGTNAEGWLMADGTLYRVDLASGKATALGKITGVTGDVKDIAILPAPSAM
jgi:hypothetical protein